MTLKETLKEKLTAQAALVKAAIDGSRAMTVEEQETYNSMETEIKNLEVTMKAQEEMEKKEKLMNTPAEPIIFAQPKNKDEKMWKNSADFLRAVRMAATPGGSVDNRLLIQNAASGLNESVPSEGGFLVDTDFAKTLLTKTYDASAVAARAFKVPISASSNGIKINAVDETSRADGSRYGGVRMYWEAEADTATATKPKFRQMSLDLKKLMGICYTTDELLMDAVALEAIVSKAFADEYSFKIDDACVNGDGAGKPLGILNAAALVTVAKENGQAADTILHNNITKMAARLWTRSYANAAWFINQDCMPQLESMVISVGTSGVLSPYATEYMTKGTIKGMPVIPIEQCATVGDLGDIVLADMSQYVLIDKGGLDSASSIHVRFLYDESVFRFIYRVDGQPMWNSALTPFKGSNTISPFIALAARA